MVKGVSSVSGGQREPKPGAYQDFHQGIAG